MKKAEELFSKHSCLNRAGDDEPLFVLRAKDVLAAQTIRLWASMAVGTCHTEEQIAEARMIAKQMEDWRQNQPIACAGSPVQYPPDYDGGIIPKGQEGNFRNRNGVYPDKDREKSYVQGR